MAKKDRKQRKKKERQERLRQEKHLRHFGLAFPDELTEAGLELPPETATERMLRGFGGIGSVLGKLRALLPGGQSAPGDQRRAQDFAYDAMEEPDPAKAAELARQALALDPDCADALYTLALNAAGSREEQIELLEHAVAAAERNLGGREYLEENRGHFWGLLETRPYMRARAALADILRGQGRLAEAIGHYEALLDLNPNDNQGIRDVVLGCYFLADNLQAAGRLLERYEQDSSAIFRYGYVLERFLAGDLERATEALGEARRDNPFVEPYLTGRKKLPRPLPDYYSPGDETEAIHCGVYMGEAWRRHPRALAWLKQSRKT